MMELCRQLGLNLTATDKDVIATELRLGGKRLKERERNCEMISLLSESVLYVF